MIHAKSKYKDQAAKFVDFYVSEESQLAFTKLNFEFPANTKVDVASVKEVPPLAARIYKAMSEAGQYSYMPVDHAIAPAISNEYLDALQAVLGGTMTPQQAAEASEAEAVKTRGPVK
jgi:raffinose/stachyose/melibiose transport system substrate-binding protein